MTRQELIQSAAYFRIGDVILNVATGEETRPKKKNPKNGDSHCSVSAAKEYVRNLKLKCVVEAKGENLRLVAKNRKEHMDRIEAERRKKAAAEDVAHQARLKAEEEKKAETSVES